MENKNTAAILPEMKGVYEAPVIEIVEVKVEQGFQGTITPPGGDGGHPDDDPTE